MPRITIDNSNEARLRRHFGYDNSEATEAEIDKYVLTTLAKMGKRSQCPYCDGQRTYYRNDNPNDARTVPCIHCDGTGRGNVDMHVDAFINGDGIYENKAPTS